MLDVSSGRTTCDLFQLFLISFFFIHARQEGKLKRLRVNPKDFSMNFRESELLAFGANTSKGFQRDDELS